MTWGTHQDVKHISWLLLLACPASAMGAQSPLPLASSAKSSKLSSILKSTSLGVSSVVEILCLIVWWAGEENNATHSHNGSAIWTGRQKDTKIQMHTRKVNKVHARGYVWMWWVARDSNGGESETKTRFARWKRLKMKVKKREEWQLNCQRETKSCSHHCEQSVLACCLVTDG